MIVSFINPIEYKILASLSALEFLFEYKITLKLTSFDFKDYANSLIICDLFFIYVDGMESILSRLDTNNTICDS